MLIQRVVHATSEERSLVVILVGSCQVLELIPPRPCLSLSGINEVTVSTAGNMIVTYLTPVECDNEFTKCDHSNVGR